MAVAGAASRSMRDMGPTLGCRDMATAVSVRDLRKSFGGVQAVDGASWSAQAGHITAVLGPNGAGKTTTVECLEGLQRPDAGTVRVLGVDPWGADPEHRARVGVMLQDGGLPTTSRPLPLLHHLAALYAGPADVDRAGNATRASTASRGRRCGGCPVASASGSPSRRPCSPGPTCSSSTSPRPGSTRTPASTSGTSCAPSPPAGACVVVTTHSFEEAERLADHVVILAAGCGGGRRSARRRPWRPQPRGRLLRAHGRGGPMTGPTASGDAVQRPRGCACSPGPPSRPACCSPTGNSCSSRSSCPRWHWSA